MSNHKILIQGLLALFVITNQVGFAQQVKVDSVGGTPHSSAMLDIESTSKGVLIPRLTTTQRNAVSSPATGLLVFDSTIGAFFFYNGTSWVDLSEDNLGNHTATQNIQLNGNRISNDGDTEGINIDNNGQVTLTPATTGAGNLAMLSNGDLRTFGQGTGIYLSNTAIGITGNNTNSGDMRLLTGNTARLTLSNTGEATFSNNLIGSANFTLTGNATFNGDAFLTGADDYLGIGTTSPTSQLSIFGDSSSALTLWSTDNTKNHGIAFQNSGLAYTWNIYREDVGTNAADLVIRGGNQSADITTLNERFRINKDGEVGIGTNNPTSPLHIQSTPPANANSGQLQLGESNSGNTMMLGRTQTYGFVQTQNSEPLSLNPLGNDVGIGTDSPNRKLHLHDNSSNNTYLQITNLASGSSTTDGLLIGQPSSNTYFYNYENGYMAFRTNNIERLRIEAGGDIGIGLTNPTSKLEVSGKTTTTNLKVTNGAAANKVLVSDAAGDATWQDVPSRTHTIHIPAIVMSNDVLISGTSFGTYNWNNRYVEFNDGNTETMVVNFSLPEDRTSNSYTLRILYTGNVTGNNFHIQTGAKSITTGELVGQNPGGGSTTIPGPSVANYLLEYTRGFSVASNDKWVMLYIRRNGSNTSDTNTGNLRVLAVIIEYEM